MNNCKEFVIGVLAITAIPVENISASGVNSAANSLEPTVPAAGFAPKVKNSQNEETDNPIYDGAVTIGLQPVGKASLVPVMRDSGKAKDDEGDSVAGRLHTVTVNCEVDERGGEIWGKKLALERTPHHLLVTYRDGVTQAFAAAGEDTYLCNVERDGAKVTVAFRIQNLMGLQQLVQGTT